jgi:hypothetical protein
MVFWGGGVLVCGVFGLHRCMLLSGGSLSVGLDLGLCLCRFVRMDGYWEIGRY